MELTDDQRAEALKVLALSVEEAQKRLDINITQRPGRGPFVYISDAVAELCSAEDMLSVQHRVMTNALEADNQEISQLMLESTAIIRGISEIKLRMLDLFYKSYHVATTMKTEHQDIYVKYATEYYESLADEANK